MANMVRNGSKRDFQQRERYLRQQERRTDLLTTGSRASGKSGRRHGRRLAEREAVHENVRKDPDRMINIFSLFSLVQGLVLKCEAGIVNPNHFLLLALAGAGLWALFLACSHLPIDLKLKDEEVEDTAAVERWTGICRKTFLTESSFSAIVFLILIMILT